jgi:hypothetical protein
MKAKDIAMRFYSWFEDAGDEMFYISLSSYLRSLRGGVGWQVTGWARYKRGPVERLTERGAKGVVGNRGGGGGGDA